MTIKRTAAKSNSRKVIAVSRLHSPKLCPCKVCVTRRRRAARFHHVLHSKWTHLIVFVLVAAALVMLTQWKWIETLPAGMVVSKGIELLGECVADRMFPPEILRDASM
jgi:hypothetical protein